MAIGIGSKASVYELEGGKELERLLRELPDRVSSAIARKAMRAAIAPITKAYRNNLRPILSTTTGRIASRVKRYKRSGVTVGITGPAVGEFQTKNKPGVKRRRSAIPHASWIEFGTRERTQKKTGRKTGRMTAKAPLRRAFDSNIRVSISAMRGKLKQGIDEAAKKLGKRR